MTDQSEVVTEKDEVLTSHIRLDQPFLTLVAMGLIVALLVIFSALSGWKVVNLEQERTAIAVGQASLAKDRNRLDVDLKTYSEILSQLPDLRKQRQDMESALVEKQTAVNAEETRFKALRGKLAKTEEEYKNLQDQVTSSQLTMVSNQKKTAELQKEQTSITQKNDELSLAITKLKSQQEFTQQEVTSEQKRLVVLKESISLLDKRRTELDVAISGLTDQNAPIASLTARLTELKQQIDTIEKVANGASKTLGDANRQVTLDAQGLTSAAKQADNAVVALNKGLGEIDSLAKRFDDRQKILDNALSDLSKAVLALSLASNDKLSPTVTSLSERAGQVVEITKQLSTDQETLSAGVTAMTKSAEGFAAIDEKIKSSNVALASHQKATAETIAKIEGSAIELKSANEALTSHQKTFAEAVAKIESSSTEVEKLPNDLSSKKDAILQAINTLTTAALDVKTAGGDFSEVIKSLKTLRAEMETTLQRASSGEQATSGTPSSPVDEIPKKLKN